MPKNPDKGKAKAEPKPTKVCPRCGLEQDRYHDFQWRSNGTVFSWCKTCNREYQAERRALKRKAGK